MSINNGPESRPPQEIEGPVSQISCLGRIELHIDNDGENVLNLGGFGEYKHTQEKVALTAHQFHQKPLEVHMHLTTGQLKHLEINHGCTVKIDGFKAHDDFNVSLYDTGSLVAIS